MESYPLIDRSILQGTESGQAKLQTFDALSSPFCYIESALRAYARYIPGPEKIPTS